MLKLLIIYNNMTKVKIYVALDDVILFRIFLFMREKLF